MVRAGKFQVVCIRCDILVRIIKIHRVFCAHGQNRPEFFLAYWAAHLAGAVVAGLTAPGKRFFGFARDARDEAKKVVWPTRKETMQMTGVVAAFVVVMSLFLWMVDGLLAWLVKLAIGQGA